MIIALPLHLHAPAAVAAMKAGLHVMTEKLMGHSVHECKEMARVAAANQAAAGHRPPAPLQHPLRRRGRDDPPGAAGPAAPHPPQWHRGNLPGNDSWQQPMPKAPSPTIRRPTSWTRNWKNWSATWTSSRDKSKSAAEVGKEVAQVRAQIADAGRCQEVRLRGPATSRTPSGKVVYHRPAIEELIRWRLWDRTGGGLMAELGSHQLDAASIFIAAAHGGQKQHPLSVAAAGDRPLFPPDRDVEDHVYCIFEFPAPGYDPKDPIASRKKIGVQYASINGNGFGGYGETVFGTEGTLLLETEKEAMLFKTHETGSKTKVVAAKGRQEERPAALQVDEDGDPESAAIGTLGTLPAERGYTEELEHWAWCIRNRSPENLPHCHPKVALGDAVIALTSQHGRPARARASSSRRSGSTSTATKRRKA